MNRKFLLLLSAFLLLSVYRCRSTSGNPPAVVDSVDLKRYAGTWYQIAFYPNSFQDADCGLTTAEYIPLENNEIKVINTCYEDKEMREVRDSVTDTAEVVDRSTNAKLEVTFFWPFSGDYWVIMLGDSYNYAVVSEPGRENLWILYREKSMPQNLYENIKTELQKRGFSTEKLVVTASITE